MTEKQFKMSITRTKATGIILEKELSTDEVYAILMDYKNENEQLKRKMEKVYNSLVDENEQLKIKFKEERDTAMKLGSECDNLTIKNQKLALEIIRLERIIKTGEKND